MTRKKRSHKFLVGVFWFSLILMAGLSWFYTTHTVPDRLNLIANEEEIFHFSLPLGITLESDSEEVMLGNGSNIPADKVRIQAAEPVAMYGRNEGSYHVGMKLFGVIPMKDIQVDVVNSTYAVPCGMPVGIYLKSDGVMVIGTGQVTNETGNVVEPAFGALKSGDYIEKVNGQVLKDKSALIEAVNASSGRSVLLSVRRDGEEIQVELRPVLTEDGSYKLGAWVRDDTQGIGTVTYVDMNGSFGALGHGISDSDTGMLVDIENGELLQHCGPWPISVAQEKPQLTYPLAFDHPGSLTAEAKHGDVTLCRFDGDNGEYSMLLGRAKGVEGPKGMGTYLWVEVENIKRLETKIVEGPYIHHCVGIHKDVVPVLYEACKYIGIKPDLYDPIEEDVKAYLRGE